ncbi:protein of unknown function [Nitrospira japonica]|uniref:MPN domain-containing protein n=1 Tax=Nitrospira japonica TaxID=1325564 RepID=A0A1W1IA48_9BACT|nr:protein of unknown function [Nitrospira japonica]
MCEDSGEGTVLAVHFSTSAAALLRPHSTGLDRELFIVVGLDAKHRVIGINLVSIGSLTLAIVHPREVFKPLILMNASVWLCAHNHPSGDVTPSLEDRTLTKRLREAADLLGMVPVGSSQSHWSGEIQLCG